MEKEPILKELEADEENTQDKEDYWKELLKFVGQEVIVESFLENTIVETKGILKALNFQYLNCIIMTPDEKILVRNFFRIRRKRINNIESESRRKL